MLFLHTKHTHTQAETENRREIDFEKEYIKIEYKKADLVFLQELKSETFNQLIDLCRWIDSENKRRRAINSFNSTHVKVKYFNNPK